MTKTKTMIALALAASTAYGVHRWRAAPATDTDRGQAVINRVWIDHLPKTERESVEIFVAVNEETAGRDLGIFDARSVWKGSFEMFTYEAKQGKLVATFPQTGTKETYSAVASRCDKQGMDFCLKLDGGTHGVHEYYSRKGWEIEGAQTPESIDARAQQIEAQLAAE